MRFRAVATALIACLVSQSVANAYTEQEHDALRWGSITFGVLQFPLDPMIADAEKKAGKALLFPTRSTNLNGYTAEWQIRNSCLWLEKFVGQFGDDVVSASVFLGKNKLPAKADWYTGTLQLPVGDFDFDKKAWPLVIEVQIKNGKVIQTQGIPNGKEKFDAEKPEDESPRKWQGDSQM